MKRVHRSTKDRVRLFEQHGGICHLCGGKIHAGEAWDWSHPIALEAGGSDDWDNAAPAHRRCHRTHTAEHDAPLIAKIRRTRAKHLGAKEKRPWNPGLRKKVNGQTVRRHHP